MIETARTLGYDLVTVGDCLGDPPVNWYRNPTTGQAKDARGASPPAVLEQSASGGGQQGSSSVSSGSSSSNAGQSTASGTTTKTSSSVVPTPTAVVSVDFGLGKIGDVTSTSRTPAAVTGLSVTPASPSSEAVAGTGVPSGAGRGMVGAWAAGICWMWWIVVLFMA